MLILSVEYDLISDVFDTDRSKAVVLVLYLFCVVLLFFTIRRLMLSLTLLIVLMCLVLFSSMITLGKRLSRALANVTFFPFFFFFFYLFIFFPLRFKVGCGL